MQRSHLKLILVSGLGSGLIRPAPGTWGSLAAAVVWVLLAGALDATATSVATAVLAVAASVGCVALGPWAIRWAGKHDPSLVVLDEWAGQWVALLGVSLLGHWPRWSGLFATSPRGRWNVVLLAAAIQFALFRLFDITKPPPCRRLEQLRAGWGILADDLMAGLYAAAVGAMLLPMVV